MLKLMIKGFTLAETIVAMVISLLLVFVIFESIYYFSTRTAMKVKGNAATQDLFLFKADMERLFNDSPVILQQDSTLLFYSHDTIRAVYSFIIGEKIIRRAGIFTDTLNIVAEGKTVYSYAWESKIMVDSLVLQLKVNRSREVLRVHRNIYGSSLFNRDLQTRK